MAATDESQMLSSEYRESRDIKRVKKEWDPFLRHQLGRHWEMIQEGIKGFLRARDDVFKALAKYERDETAELICGEFMDNVFPDALDVLAQLGPVVNKYPSYFKDAADMTIEDFDARSITMGPESSLSSRPGPTTSMGPPPRPTAPMKPVFGPATRGKTDVCGKESDNAEPPSIYEIPDSPPSDDYDHGALTWQKNGKRSRDTLGTEALDTSGAPSKKAKRANGTQRTIDIQDIEGAEYIFRDKRCGPGHYVIRCNVGKSPRRGQPGVFVTPPLEEDTALDHFKSKSATCHDTTKDYTIEDIIHEFAHRVFRSGKAVTVKEVKESNQALQRYRDQDATEGSAKMSAKGKEKATDSDAFSFVNNSIRARTDDGDGDEDSLDEVRE